MQPRPIRETIAPCNPSFCLLIISIEPPLYKTPNRMMFQDRDLQNTCLILQSFGPQRGSQPEPERPCTVSPHTFRTRRASSTGLVPKKRLNSLLNCDALS